jgi:diguanylate cyclase (GGDEF)-like protein
MSETSPNHETQNRSLDDGRATDPVDRLMEESWETRSSRASRREVAVEAVAAMSFVAIAGPLAGPAISSVNPTLALMLVILYAIVSGVVRFPIGAGYVVPSYVMLVPMLLLLPPSTVPLFTATALLGAGMARWANKDGSAEQVLFSVPNAWHSLGPALVLMVAGRDHHSTLAATGIYLGAFMAGCVLDLAVSTLRESIGLAVAPKLQMRVVASVWLIDACIAPVGLLLASAARHDEAALLMVLPLSALLLILERDRSARIGQAQHRLELVGRERTRLQAAVRRLGDAFAAKLDLSSLTSIALRGSMDALDADAGRLILEVPHRPSLIETEGAAGVASLLEQAGKLARRTQQPEQLEDDGVWALALPIAGTADDELRGGALAVARRDREFREDEQTLMLGLVERARTAVCEILAHEVLREQAVTDPLTRLGNRRKLAADLAKRMDTFEAPAEPLVLMLFDLDGFKTYNDTFGHIAGDALLARLGSKLNTVVAPRGTAYRLGGDEFCVLLPAQPDELRDAVAAAAGALHEHGETFSIEASCGAVLLPHEASTPEYALQLADERMYAQKQSRPLAAREQTRNVLVRIMHAKQPGLPDHSNGVSRLAVAVGRQLGMSAEQIDELARAAELHDIGKVGVPDAILDKPGPLDDDEWEYVRQHTIFGERILSAAPALRPVATIVRASHERWDGMGYPDRLAGENIPLAARIVAACDAYDAITSDRCYRRARSPEEARAELVAEAGRQFDPKVIAAVLDELDRQEAEGSEAFPSAAPEHFAEELVQRLMRALETPEPEVPGEPPELKLAAQ